MPMNMMSPRTPRILKYLFFGLMVLALLLLLFLNSNLAALADMIYPGSGLWAHGALLGVELIALGWFWRGLFRGPKHLLLLDKSSPEAQQAFEKELKRRMRSNPHVAKAGIGPLLENGKEDPEYLDRCMALLRQKADEEIKLNARRVFLATALSQNGKLDAIIVCFALCRLVWRVSSIFNQRPHPSEMLSLYWAVASTTFLAFSIEELDIATEVTVGFGEALHAIVPAGISASIPFAGNVLKIFTASTIDGTANCYLALRAGIITRNAYSYAWKLEEKPSRADVFREAGGHLMGMSQELVGKVAATVTISLSNAAKNAFINAGDKTVKTGKNLAEGLSKVGQGIGSGAGKIAAGAVSGATKIASEAAGVVDKLASEVVDAAAKINSGAEKVVAGATQAVGATREGISSAKEYASGKINPAQPAARPEKFSLKRFGRKIIGKGKQADSPPQDKADSADSALTRRQPLLGLKKNGSLRTKKKDQA